VAELIAAPRATELLARMAGRRVVVVGDAMIDEWIWGDVSRISPEAPVPVVAVHEHTFTLGGAGNVVNNLHALGARIALVGCVGDDDEGRRLREMLAALGVDTQGVLTTTDRPTTRKTRIVARGQQVVRADWESTAALSEATARGSWRARVRRCATPMRSCSATTPRVCCSGTSSKRRSQHRSWWRTRSRPTQRSSAA
jgi:rfaE bifunctional protein kinase chain/domain